jgi:hypothetical protein
MRKKQGNIFPHPTQQITTKNTGDNKKQHDDDDDDHDDNDGTWLSDYRRGFDW